MGSLRKDLATRFVVPLRYHSRRLQYSIGEEVLSASRRHERVGVIQVYLVLYIFKDHSGSLGADRNGIVYVGELSTCGVWVDIQGIQ